MNSPTIHLSSDFVEILFSMESQSNIARMLIHQDFDGSILVDKHPNFIGVSKDDRTKISYLPYERIETTSDKWGASRRIMAKPGVFLRKIFKDLSDKDVETFSTLYRSIQNRPEFELKVLDGEDIRKWYYYENYLDQSSSLGNSCMKHRSCQKYMDIYVMNPEQIKMLVMKKNGSLIGRAILWMDAKDEDGVSFKVMDRIYTIDDETYFFHFRKWADENGYIYKKEQKWNNTLNFVSNNEVISKRLSVNLSSFNFGYYPYMDTFKFLNIENGMITNSKPKDVTSFVTITNAEGITQTMDTLEEDGLNNLFYYRHDMTFIPNRNIWTYANDNVCYSEVYDVHLLREDAVRHSFLGHWIYKDDSQNDHELINSLVDKEKKWREEMEREREKRLQRERERLEETRRTEERMNNVSPSDLQNLQGGWSGGWSLRGRSIRELINHHLNEVYRETNE